MATTKLITVDGTFSDWDASELISTPVNFVPGYSLYGTVQGDTYFIGIDATSLTDPVIGAGTTIWLNTDQNTATGYSPFGNIGAEYNITYIPNATGGGGDFYLYTGAAAETLVSTTPLTAALSADGKSLEIAIPRSLVTPAGGTPPININVAGWIDNGAVYLPGDFTNPEYTITDPAALQAKTVTHKVAIVYSDTTAANYFRGLGDAAGAPSTAYSDLFMAAQNQARMAGVSYDVIDELQLTDINNLIGYDALIFPAMTNVNTAQLPAIMSTLTSAVYNYHIGIITSGDFLTNDQTGAALANPYANMLTLLGLTRTAGGNSGDVTVTAVNDGSSPIMQSYANGEVIQTYSGAGYTGYQASGTTPYDVLVNQNVANVGTIPGVVETTVGGATNVHFATQALLGDSNLLSDAIQAVVLGTSPGVTLHTSRGAGIVAARMDMDQAQNPVDVSPTSGPGIYDLLIPILQGWKAQYDFVGSYYVDIGDQTTGADPTGTVWAKSVPYYQQIQGLGGEIGSHSYTHLINPPATTFTAHVVGGKSAGSTTITLDQVPSFYGITVGMWLTGIGIGSNTLPSGAVVHTQVTAVSGNTITISFDPDGAGPSGNVGTTGALSNGQTLTFSIPSENTSFLEPTTGTDLSSDGHPFTYQYEFGDSKTLLQQKLGTLIYGAAVPGAAETLATSKNILAYYPSGTGYTGYVTGGWTGIESGYPSAFGYIDPTHQGSVYIAPNVTFDFTEIQYQGKTVAQALADWTAQFNALTSHAAGTPILVWPIHDYGAADWNSTTNSPDDPAYTTQLYTSFIQLAYNAGYEFVTLEDLASRIAAQEKAHIDYTTVGNTITATVTPDPTAPDLGAMALDVVNNGTQVIQNVTNWYAYNAQELFLPRNGGSYTINLGTTQDDVTHIAALPMRGDLLSVSGDGSNLNFSMVGDGNVLVDLAGTATAVVTGATTVSQIGDQLTLGFTGLGQHDVTILLPVVTTGTGSDTLVLSMSEDAYQGNAQFTVAVDGVQLGGTFTATASKAAGASQAFAFLGDWNIGSHAVTVNFLSDAYGGTPTTDRNLYVTGISYDGISTGLSAALLGQGPRKFSVTDSTAIASPPVTTGAGSDTLVLSISEDAYQGDAQFTVAIDGKQLGGTFTATASKAAGASQAFAFLGDWNIGSHVVTVNFLNDAYGGTPTTDRNLYVTGISYDGISTGLSAALLGQGPRKFSVTDSTAIASPPVTTGAGSDTLVLSISEDAYQGDAQFTVAIDGKQLGGTFTTTALHASGTSQSFTFKGDFGAGQHVVAVNFVNDAYGGTPLTDRNLYVNGVSYGGASTNQSAALMAGGPKTFAVSGGTTPSVSETGDHGSLAKDLSQTGTYTVGDDTFVLNTGNAASVTLGTGTSQIKFIGASSITLTGGSGQATITADTGSNKFVAGTGSLDVTGGGGLNAYVFHANSGLLTLEDFSPAKGDTLTVDKALQGSLFQASDGQGGVMLTFGTGAGHGVDIHGMAAMPGTSILWA